MKDTFMFPFFKRKSIFHVAGRLFSVRFVRIMKYTAILMVVACMQVSATAYSQLVSLQVKDARLEHIFRQIRKQTGYNFLYKNELLEKSPPITIHVKDRPLSEVLGELFKGRELTYVIQEKTILVKRGFSTISIKPKEEVNQKAMIPSAPAGQTDRTVFSVKPVTRDLQEKSITVKGRITDEKGEGLPGVNVVQKGTQRGTITESDGRFSIEVEETGAVLVISFVGFVTQEIPLGGRTFIETSMKVNTKTLDEVLVVGYGTQKKINQTGAIAQVNEKVLESRPLTNLGQGLQGVVANLNINPGSGAPGRGVTFNIRGNTSINGGSPLVLVDGVQMDPNLINPQDVQSVTVLKDAASASIYGARAAFGVILITTKNGGKNKKPVVSFSMNQTVNKPTVVPESMNSIEYTRFMNDGNMTSNGSPYFDDETMDHVRAYFKDPVNTPTMFQHSQDPIGIFRENANTIWSDELLKKSYPMGQYNASISGGSDKVTYYSSFGYMNQKGISKPGSENFDRYNIMQNVSYNVNSWITLRAKAAYNEVRQKMNPSNSTNNFGGDEIYASYSAWPIIPVYAPDGNFDETKGYNMVAYLKSGGHQKQQNKDLWLTGALKLTPVKGLSVNLDYTYNAFFGDYLNFRKQYYTRDNGAILLSPWGNISAVTRKATNNTYTALNAFAEYEKEMEKHAFKVLVGFNQEFGGLGWFQAERQNLINNDIGYMSLATGDRFATDGASEYAIRGAFSRINYSFANKYLFEVNGRYDGSSRFPSKDRFAFFPSLSAGWRISGENFFDGLRGVISDLKVRASLGSLGNQAVSSYYPYIATYGTGEVPYLFGGNRLMSVYAPGLVSPTLTWENVIQRNLGVDITAFGDRLTGGFDFYTRETKEMLAKSRSLPSVLATAEPQTNAADMKTTGFEITLGWREQLRNGLRYSLNLMLSDYTAKITKYDNPQRIISDYYNGKVLGEIWGFETEGLFKSDGEAASLDQSQISAHQFLVGDLKFRDLNGDGKITRGAQTLDDHGDLTRIGNSTPRYSYGMRGEAEWKGFDLTVFFQGVGKRSVLPNSIYFLQHYTSEWAVPQKVNNDYWRPDNQDAYFPRARIGNAPEIVQAQSRFLQNAAYLRLKQLTIGYAVPTRLIEKTPLENVRIYLAGSNLWEYSKTLKIFDPESFASNMYPLSRSYSIGVNLTF